MTAKTNYPNLRYSPITAKVVALSLIYGMTLGSLRFRLEMDMERAKKVYDDYMTNFPAIMPWMNKVIAECQRTGYVRYWSGRIWREDDPMCCYRAANALIQGGCADLLSIAAIRASKWMKEQDFDAHIVSFIHDEILIELPEDKVLYTARALMPMMQVTDLLGIPFITDVEASYSYGEMVKIPKSILEDKSINTITVAELRKIEKESHVETVPEVTEFIAEESEEEDDEKEIEDTLCNV